MSRELCCWLFDLPCDFQSSTSVQLLPGLYLRAAKHPQKDKLCRFGDFSVLYGEFPDPPMVGLVLPFRDSSHCLIQQNTLSSQL